MCWQVGVKQIKSYKVSPTESNVQTIIRKWGEKVFKLCVTPLRKLDYCVAVFFSVFCAEMTFCFFFLVDVGNLSTLSLEDGSGRRES